MGGGLALSASDLEDPRRSSYAGRQGNGFLLKALTLVLVASTAGFIWSSFHSQLKPAPVKAVHRKAGVISSTNSGSSGSSNSSSSSSSGYFSMPAEVAGSVSTGVALATTMSGSLVAANRTPEQLEELSTAAYTLPLQTDAAREVLEHLPEHTSLEAMVHKQQQQQQQQGRGYVSFVQQHASIKSSEEALSAQPFVRGHVLKEGAAPREDWALAKQDVRLDSFLGWRVNRTRKSWSLTKEAYSCPAADHPSLPFPGCHVFVNHRYKLIYIRSPKSASTTLVDELGECSNRFTRHQNASSCMTIHLKWEAVTPGELVEQMWKEYFVFAFVRNPWRRAYSLFSYLQSSACMSAKNRARKECSTQWSNFCVSPWSEVERLHDLDCSFRTKSYLYFHMMDQYHCLRGPNGGWALDYIGVVEDLNKDWAVIVQEVNKRRDPAAPQLVYRDLEPLNVKAGKFDDPYRANPHCLDAVSSWYACDVERFGYQSKAAFDEHGLPITL